MSMKPSTQNLLDSEFVAAENDRHAAALQQDYEALGAKLSRQGQDIEALVERAQAFSVALPSWGVGTGGTRFARFPGRGEPRNVFEKVDDCAVINQLSGVTPGISLHIPWDKPSDPAELRAYTTARGLYFDAMNSNTFQDQAEQAHSYKFGSLSHTQDNSREQAVAHNIEVIELGQALGSKALTVWVGDGSNFPDSSISAALSAAIWTASAAFTPRCRKTGACCWSTRFTNRRFIPP
ncbi:MAG: hypothetical protein R3E95_09460 [Thiolinea sp.]